ncbi:MAG: low molecular weight phosphotyrosine protein phosphatase [Rhodocyclaceae bacterium]|jgi:protein-tyrosine phosphatase|nr:low molecular weight phosphotyrosine protein phosphatase [Rhodocyclaceae bacterium]
MKRVLFVCTGNICRSPTAEAVARHLIRLRGLEGRIEVDSAATHGYHVGEAPDPRTLRFAARRGYDMAELRARKLEIADFQRFDLLLAMDAGHLEIMRSACPAVYRDRVDLLMRYARRYAIAEVPDPYYGGDAGFEAVLDYCEDAVGGVLDALA